MLNMEDVVSTIMSTLINAASLSYIKFSTANPGRLKMPNAPVFVGFVEPSEPIHPVDNKIGFSLNYAEVVITLRKYTSKVGVTGSKTIYDMENDVKAVLYHNLHNGEFTRHKEDEFANQAYRMAGDLNEFKMIYRVAKEISN